MKRHVSEHLNYHVSGHANFEFVDINLLNDTKLFVDPCLLEVSDNEYGQEASIVLQNFFDNFYNALRTNNRERYNYLLTHARERNATKLGYGNGKNGHGNRAEGLQDKLMPLWRLIQTIPFEKPMDIVVFIRGFGPDGISDLITNIVCKQLLSFTHEECRKQNERFLTPMTHWYWDRRREEWVEETVRYPTYHNDPFLLVPKDCVRNELVFDASDYLSKAILERQKRESRYTDAKGKEKYTPKKDLMERIPKDNDDWRYGYSEEYTRIHPEILSNYHDYLNSIYRGKRLSNEELDELVYPEH